MDILAKKLGSLISPFIFCGIINAAQSPVPGIDREMRGVWVTTVYNVDWPSNKTLSTADQKAEMSRILDKAAQLKLNTIVLQVRPSCDALYESKLEPWSEVLTGKMGNPPNPFYDPLKFAVEEAHKRGMELHAWFNPFRARLSSKVIVSENHVTKTHPEFVRSYGTYLWLDPGEKAAQDYSLKVMLDVVRRYDIDGIQIDDYFYPGLARDAAGKIVDFPDETPWNHYKKAGGKLSRPDWRRENINIFIQRLYSGTKAEKAWVKVGISPPGIWRPGNPPQIKGRDVFTDIYADTKLWFSKGWCDYFAPQLYWDIEKKEQSFPVLLKWWTEQNNQRRILVPGLATGNVADKWKTQEIINQIQITQKQAGASGYIHYHTRPLMRNSKGIADELARLHAQPALPPAMPWLSKKTPAKPKVSLTRTPHYIQLQWEPSSKIGWYVVQKRSGESWSAQVLPGEAGLQIFDTKENLNTFAVTAVDRFGNASAPAVLNLAAKK